MSSGLKIYGCLLATIHITQFTLNIKEALLGTVLGIYESKTRSAGFNETINIF